MNPNIRVGTYKGTGNAVTIILGFVPDHVRVLNATTGAVVWEWFEGMADDSAHESRNHASDQNRLIAANAISPFPGTPGEEGAGFTVGTALSANGETFRYVAIRSGAGAE